ncbi:MAG: hypothetical protein H7061_05380 [Bdellovibrionaceae bacterium]|nr:hypothetical protein [Bdellovibrio sp.]
MRTLTQVWVFFVSLTLVLLFAGFQVGGRRGLFIAFILSLVLIYATLHRGLALFKRHLNVKEQTGNDTGGFRELLQMYKNQFGMDEVILHFSNRATPPLVWKNSPESGHVLVHRELLNHLTSTEKNILAHFVLAHLAERSFLIPRILSIFEQGFWGLNYLVAPVATLITQILRIPATLLKADLKTMQTAGISSFEMGYFIQKLHGFSFHNTKTLKGGEFFSTLTLKNRRGWLTHGHPQLKTRLINVMGFEP